MKTKTLYKFLRTGLKSDSGDCVWKVGEWKHEDKLYICHRGFHASKTPLQALGYVKGEIIARVEVKGNSIIQDDKECWSDMRVVKSYYWKKEDSVELAIFSAELVIDIFEKKYPKDDRPRKAIEAAKAYLVAIKSGNKKAAAAAAAADAARAAYAAARAAAYAAAAYAAAAAAAAAADAAYAAAADAAAAAAAAARAAAAAYAAAAADAADAADAAAYAAADVAAADVARKELMVKILKYAMTLLTKGDAK